VTRSIDFIATRSPLSLRWTRKQRLPRRSVVTIGSMLGTTKCPARISLRSGSFGSGRSIERGSPSASVT